MKILKSMRCQINQSNPLPFAPTVLTVAALALFSICLTVSTATAQTGKSPSNKTGITEAKQTKGKPKEPAKKAVKPPRPPAVSAAADATQTGKIAGKITVVKDEFTGKRTITLTAHPVSETLTVSLTTVVPLNDTRTAMEKYLSYATVNFVSTSGSIEYGLAKEVNFLVDGKRVAGNAAQSDLFGSSGNRRVETVVTTLGFDIIQKVAQGGEVQMKPGENIFELNETFRKLLKDFLKAAP